MTIRGLLTGVGSSNKSIGPEADKSSKKAEKKPVKKMPSLAAASTNPLFSHTTIRDLPAELKNRILWLSHPSQSLTALFATLFHGVGLPGVRGHGDDAVTLRNVMESRGTPVMPMSLTDMAKMIGRSPHPNIQRDLLSSDPRQRPATLHPDIYMEGLRVRGDATSYEREQMHALLATDYSKLEQLGKVSAVQEARIVRALEYQIGGDTEQDNRNRHESDAPSSSAVADALLVGLSTRLVEIKAGPQQALRTVLRALNGGHRFGIGDGPMILVGASSAARYAALCDSLMGIASLKKSPASQEEVFSAFLDVMNGDIFHHFHIGQMADLAVRFVDAISAFVDCKVGDNKAKLSDMAMVEFRSIIAGRSVHNEEYSSRVSEFFAPEARAYIIGAAARNLASHSSAIRNSPLEEAQAKKMLAFLDRSKAIAPWRSSVQATLLNHMLEALELGARKKDPKMTNLLFAVENDEAWAGLLATAPSLNQDAQKKIYTGFLKQLEKSRLLTEVSEQQFGLANASYKKQRANKAIDIDDLNACRHRVMASFDQLRNALPTVQQPDLAERMSASLEQYTALLSDYSRSMFLAPESRE